MVMVVRSGTLLPAALLILLGLQEAVWTGLELRQGRTAVRAGQRGRPLLGVTRLALLVNCLGTRA